MRVLVFRVWFSGPPLSDAARNALDALNRRWEGGNRALVGAASDDEAASLVREALTGHGSFHDFRAEPVRDRHGKIKQTPIRKGCWEIDWTEVKRTTDLSELQRTILCTFLNVAEPTWIIIRDPEVREERDRVEAALNDLQRRNLVYSTWEQSGAPEAGPAEMDNWWALTDEGWDLLGLIKSPGYG
jgi:hypothetical protein